MLLKHWCCWWWCADHQQGWLKAPEIHIWILGLFPKILFEYGVFWKSQGWLKVHYNRGIPIFKYEKIEVCIYEIPRELVFIYGISGWNSPLGSVRVLQQGTNQTNEVNHNNKWTMVLTTVVLSIDRGYITVHYNLFLFNAAYLWGQSKNFSLLTLSRNNSR